jgi:hypothetical protein
MTSPSEKRGKRLKALEKAAAAKEKAAEAAPEKKVTRSPTKPTAKKKSN